MEEIKKSIDQSPYTKDLPEKRRESLAELAVFVRELQKQYHVRGHGISTEQEAKSIQEHGLHTKWSALQDLTHALEKDEARVARQVTYWILKPENTLSLSRCLCTTTIWRQMLPTKIEMDG